MMDAELGEGGRNSTGSVAPVSGSLVGVAPVGGALGGAAPGGGAAPLPLPDAAALDWAALVHTATRAMLQVHTLHCQNVRSV